MKLILIAVLVLTLPLPAALGRVGVESGPMVGHTTETTASIWAFDSDAETPDVDFWPTGGDPSRQAPVAIKAAEAKGRVFRHSFTGLAPETAYLYRIRVEGRDPTLGSFTTAPRANQPNRFSYAVTG